MTRIKFTNQYGTLEIEVNSYQEVSTIYGKDFKANHFSLDDAEKIALITENKGVQLCIISGTTGKMFLIHHTAPNIAAVCKIIKLDFNGDYNAREELAKPRAFFL